MEEEIKIEYIETSAADPLALDSPSLIEATHVPVPSITMPLMEINEAAELQEVDRKVQNLKNNEVNTNLKEKGHILDSALDVMQETVAWYKSIDSFGKLICNFCDNTYSVLTSLRYHVHTKHPDKVISVKNKILQKRRRSQPFCHVCKKRFKLLTELKNHIQTHKIENVANSCKHCNASFGDYGEVLQHIKYNHNIMHKKLHVCVTCGYRTQKLSHMKQHSDIHLLEKRYKCKFCDYATNRKSNLKNHERIHTKNKLFVCNFDGCKGSFTDVTALNYHVQKHSPKNLFYCDKCSYQTVYKQSLKVHIESHMRR